VGIIANNCVEWAVVAYATYGLSAHLVPMYESQREEEWVYILQDSGARLLFVRDAGIFERTRGLPETVATLERVIHLEAAKSGPDSFAELMATGRRQPVAAASPAPDEPVGLIYTSGTTGRPKGVILSHGGMVTEIESLCGIFGDLITTADRGLSFLPWGHLMGQLEEVHILIHQGFSSGLVRDVNAIAEDLALVRPTVFFSVPRIFNRIHEVVSERIRTRGGLGAFLFERGLAAFRRRREGIAAGPKDALWIFLARRLVTPRIRQVFGGRLRMAVSGGAALRADVIHFMDFVGVPVYEGYGSTETTMAVTINRPGARRPGTVGQAIPGATVSLDRTVDSLHPEEGEIIVHGPLLMQGYHNLPEATAAVFTADGGFRTGDLGRFDADGYLTITGRIKEIYKLENGKYVAPTPIEEALQDSPYIAQAMVVGTNRPYNVAILVPEMAALEVSARQSGVDRGGSGWSDHPTIRELLAGEIERTTQAFKGFERPRGFVLAPAPWSTDDGTLTPTLKLKRRQIVARHADEIEALYAEGRR